MEKQVETQVHGQAPKRNPGRFRPGDPRINRSGRPRGRKPAAQEKIHPGDIAAKSGDRLMRLVVPRRELVRRLTRSQACWWIQNLPNDAEMVSAYADEARDAVVFIIRSATFCRIALGTLIPKFQPVGDGVRSWAERPELR